MKLVLEQISYLRERQRQLKESIASYKDYLASRDITSSDESAGPIVGDPLTDDQYQRERTSYNEVMVLLTNAEYVTERDTDTIQIGTKFIYEVPNIAATQTVILTDGIFSLMPNKGFVSSAGPLGKSVIGKKEGETFQFSLPGTNHLSNRVTGTIKEIKKEPTDYVHFVREKDIEYRISRAERRRRRENPEITIQAPEITESQKLLLLIEKERLLRGQKDAHTTGRAAHIDRLLKISSVATPPTDGTIGIGTRFEVVITDGENDVVRNFEMVNSAVSDELEDAYVERIGRLGSKLYGLRQDDKFSFRKDGKTYAGAVLKVEIPQKGTAIQLKK